jgi:uncharacterized glyoxalase superfamily protein PhnB
MTTQTSTPTFYPGLLYRDADSGIKWLEDVLGCERREDHRDDDGNVVHAELVFRGSVVMLSTAGVGREPFRSLPAGGRLVTARSTRSTPSTSASARPAATSPLR